MTAQQKAMKRIVGFWKEARPALGVPKAPPPRIHFIPSGQGWVFTAEDPDGILAISVGPGAVKALISEKPETINSIRFDFFHEFPRMYQSRMVWEAPSANAGSGTANGFANRLLRKRNGKKGADPKGYARKHFPDFGKDPQSITLAGKSRSAQRRVAARVAARRPKRSGAAQRVIARAKKRRLKKSVFNEDEHPRGKDGKFTESIDATVAAIEKVVDGITIDASENAQGITLSRVAVTEDAKGQGKASAALKKLLAYADRQGKVVALTPEPIGTGGLSKARLTQWYKRHGFVPNKGRNKDFAFTQTMLRQPGVQKAAGPVGDRGKVGKEMGAIRDLLVKTFGADPAKVDAHLDGIEKAGAVTFAERMAQRELDDELPDAMSVLRSCVFWAFNPPPDAGDVDPKQVISDSLDQFKVWALALVDRAAGDSVAKQVEDAQKAEQAIVKLAREGLAVRKSAGPKSDSATVSDVEIEDIIGDDTDGEKSVEDRIGDLEETVAKLTPENIAKAMKKLAKETPPGEGGDAEGEGDGSGDGAADGEGDGKGKSEPVTKAQLEEAIEKIVTDATEKVNDLSEKIEKLGEGGSSQGSDDVAKAVDAHEERVAKAMEAEGFDEKDAKALGGIFD